MPKIIGHTAWHIGIGACIPLCIGSIVFAQTQQDLPDADRSTRPTQSLAYPAPACGMQSSSMTTGNTGNSTRIFQAKADRYAQTGRFLSYSIDRKTGDLSEALWDASSKLPVPNLRQIVTTNADETPAAFRWASLDASRKKQLEDDASLLDYLRGDASEEGSRFRARKDATGPNRLGAIASAPVFVGAPAFRYRNGSESVPYSSFAEAHRDRREMIYVGASDGMLHGFDAATGVETFAFVPGSLLPRLRNLSSNSAYHQAYVDGPPSVGDAFINGAWRTVLVGGLNAGGRSVYALDITEPGTFAAAESQPGRLVLWEFTAARDADLGLTFSQPVIAKLRDGTWAAIFGNGYRSRSADGVSSKTGNAVLYVVDIANGNIIRKLDTGVGDSAAPDGAVWQNGLSTPAAVDVDGDRVIEYVYAGDLYGNLWKFDFTALRSSDWNIAFAGEPLFQARSANGQTQPITLRPEVSRGPHGIGVVVLFGAGNDPEVTGISSAPANHTFYGVVDRHAGIIPGRQSLQMQQVTHELPIDRRGDFTQVRVVTARSSQTNAGWYVDLTSPLAQPVKGHDERLTTPPALRDSKIFFRTQIANGEPCVPVLTWTMALDVLNGGSDVEIAHPAFDLTDDGRFNESDGVVTNVKGAPTRVAISGISSYSPASRALTSPVIVEGETVSGACAQYLYLPGPSADTLRLTTSCRVGGTARQSWRQIR